MSAALLVAVAGIAVAALSAASADDLNFNRDESHPFARQVFTYKTVGDLEIHADVYRASDMEVRPVLMWIHGGALIFGSRRDVPARLVELAHQEGFIFVSIDYRLAPEVKLPAIIEDLVDAVTWVREKGPELFGADPARLVIAGESAGGYLAMMSGVCILPRPTALVAYYGYGTVDGPWYTEPSEFYRDRFPLIAAEDAWSQVGGSVLTTADLASGRGKFYLFLRQNGLWTEAVTGLDPATDGSQIQPYCPVRNIRPDYPPILMLHGTADTDVPYAESAGMARELARHGVPYRLMALEGAGHGLVDGDRQKVAEAHMEALQFIRKNLARP